MGRGNVQFTFRMTILIFSPIVWKYRSIN